MEALEFKLSQPIDVSIEGNFTNVDTLDLKAPPAFEKSLPIRLRSGFMKAAMGMADPDRKKPDDEAPVDQEDSDQTLEGPEIEGLIFASDIDPESYMVDFRKLMITEGVCKIGGQKFQKTHWDKVTAEDAMRLMGEYIAHFFAPSWLPKKTTKS